MNSATRSRRNPQFYIFLIRVPLLWFYHRCFGEKSNGHPGWLPRYWRSRTFNSKVRVPKKFQQLYKNFNSCVKNFNSCVTKSVYLTNIFGASNNLLRLTTWFLYQFTNSRYKGIRFIWNDIIRIRINPFPD